jgi:hypothetical protein
MTVVFMMMLRHGPVYLNRNGGVWGPIAMGRMTPILNQSYRSMWKLICFQLHLQIGQTANTSYFIRPLFVAQSSNAKQYRITVKNMCNRRIAILSEVKLDGAPELCDLQRCGAGIQIHGRGFDASAAAVRGRDEGVLATDKAAAMDARSRELQTHGWWLPSLGLVESLAPRQVLGSILGEWRAGGRCFRDGYCALPVAVAGRWPAAAANTGGRAGEGADANRRPICKTWMETTGLFHKY